MKNMYDKPLNKNELVLQDFIEFGYDRIKLASIIYGVSKSKGEGLSYHHKLYNPRINISVKPSNPSSSSTAQKRLNAYFLLAAEKGKILKQSEPVINNSQILKDSEPKVIVSKVPKGSEVKVKTYPRQTV